MTFEGKELELECTTHGIKLLNFKDEDGKDTYEGFEFLLKKHTKSYGDLFM